MTNEEKNTFEFNIKKDNYTDCLCSDSSFASESDLNFNLNSELSSNSSSDLNSELSSNSSSDLNSELSSAPMENTSSVIAPNNDETESNCLSLTIVDDYNHMINRNRIFKAIRMIFKVSFSTAILNIIKFFL